VWVFIDGKLVLDMGGAHALAHGSINFQTLSATVKNAAQVSTTIKNPSHYYNSYGYNGDGEQREELTIEGTKTTAFPEELAKVFQNEYNTGMSQVHTLTMFYMERAGIESNMSIEFSMSPIPTGLTISKDIENVNPGLNDDVQADDEFSFIVDATNGKDKVVFDGYDLTDHGSVTTDGVVTDGNEHRRAGIIMRRLLDRPQKGMAFQRTRRFRGIVVRKPQNPPCFRNRIDPLQRPDRFPSEPAGPHNHDVTRHFSFLL
jgi:hypothetical protein